MNGKFLLTLSSTVACVALGCGAAKNTASHSGGSAGHAGAAVQGQGGTGVSVGGTSGSGAIGASAGSSSVPSKTGSGGTGSSAGASGQNGGAAGGAAGASAVGGAGGTASGAAGSGTPATLDPSVRNPKYKSVAPALGPALPMGMPGMWNYTDIDGAFSRDGSPAGFYYKYSKTGDKNLMIYLAGGGACQDNFFCNMNPANKSESLTAESVGSGILNVAGPDAEAQDPSLPRWDSGIFKDDPSNPVKDWNMVFVPYVTGDVFAGVKPNGSVPGVSGSFQFVGHTNMMKFLARIVPTFEDAGVVVVTGSSAGGLGALLTAPFVVDAYIDLKHGARVFVVDDAGPFFDDPYLEVCLQKRYRDIFGLDMSFPEDCTTCSSPDGGGITKGYLAYLVDKYPDVLLGGLIDSDADEIMSFFFSEGLESCMYIDDPVSGLLAYPSDRYSNALKNLLDVHMKRMSSYVWSGSLHQNLFQTASGDRYYEQNGLNKTVAEWLATVLTGKMERLGL